MDVLSVLEVKINWSPEDQIYFASVVDQAIGDLIIFKHAITARMTLSDKN